MAMDPDGSDEDAEALAIGWVEELQVQKNLKTLAITELSTTPSEGEATPPFFRSPL